MTLEEVLKKYAEEQPNLILTIKYLDKNKELLFELIESTAKEILKNRNKTDYLECKVYDYKDTIINVYYPYPAIIL